jgi:hypothetical protein
MFHGDFVVTCSRQTVLRCSRASPVDLQDETSRGRVFEERLIS